MMTAKNEAKKNADSALSAKVRELIALVPQSSSEADIKLELLEKIRKNYLLLDREERNSFFRFLLEKVELDPAEVKPLIDNVLQDPEEPFEWAKKLTRLREGIISPRLKLFRHFARLPGGLKFLLDCRAHILTARQQNRLDFDPLDHDLVNLFETWFQDGFLFLKEITRDSPLRQIEIIMQGDLVHPMTSLDEMIHRLGRDRRCFALYHRVMPEEPVVFIEVALTKGIKRSIHEIIAPDNNSDNREVRKDTAVFYSINNTQNGLAGLGLGKLLIFQVVDFLKDDSPQIKNFCTLSPLPGFWRRFLKPILEAVPVPFNLTVDQVEKLFDKKTRILLEEEHRAHGGTEEAPFNQMLLEVFSRAEWARNQELVAALAKPVTRLGHLYLTEQTERKRHFDPVANFHLGNGATLNPSYINFGANWTPMGIERSLSLMVNYIYSRKWLLQIGQSVTRLGGLLPGLQRAWSGRSIENEHNHIPGS